MGNLNYNYSNFWDLRNLQEQLKKAFCYQKLFWPFTVWIKLSDFCGFSCTRGHEIWRKLKHLIFVDFHVPGVMKIEENQRVWFFGFSSTRGHENWRKSKGLIFVDFQVPGVMKIGENWSVWFLWNFMYQKLNYSRI